MQRIVPASLAIPPGAVLAPGAGLSQGVAYHWCGQLSGATFFHGQGRGGQGSLKGRRNAVLTAGASRSVGKFGPAFQFAAASSQYAECSANIEAGTNSSILSRFSNYFTISAWIKPASTSNYKCIIGERRADLNHVAALYSAITTNVVRFDLVDSSLSGTTISGTTSMVVGQWYHVAATLTPTTGKKPGACVYLNGQLEGYNAASVMDASGGDRTAIGALPTTVANGSQFLFFDGAIDMVTIFDRALSDSEIDALYRNPMLIYARRLRRFVFFTLTADATLTGDDGTITGDTTVGATGITADASLTGADGTITGDTTVFATITAAASLTGAAGTITGDTTYVGPITADASLSGAAGTITGDTTVSLPPTIQGADGTITGDTSTSALTGYPASLPAPLISRRPHHRTGGAPVVMESTRRRLRRLWPNKVQFIDLQWNLTEDQFNVFRDFCQTDLLNCSRSFELITTEISDVPHTLRRYTRTLAFMSPDLTFNRSDNLFSVSGTVEVLGEGFELFENPQDPFPVDSPEVNWLTHDSPECRDTFSVTLTEMEPTAIYCLDIGDSSNGPWESWIYFSLMVPNSPADLDTLSMTVVVNNDYEGLKWFRVRKTSALLVPTIGDRIVRHAKNPLGAAISAPDVIIDNLTEITAAVPPDESNSLLAIDGHYDMPLSAVEADRAPFGRTYYRIARKYAGKQTNINNFTDLDGADTHARQLVITSNIIGVTKWTRDASNPTEDTLIPSLDGLVGNAAVSRSDFAMLIKARTFAGSCQSPLAVVAVDKMLIEKHRCVVHLSGNSIIGSCDLSRQEQAYGYHVDAATGQTLWGPIPGVFATVESAQSCNLGWGGTVGFEHAIKDLALGSGTAIGGADVSGNALIYGVGTTWTEHNDYLGWTNHIVTGEGYKTTNVSYTRPSIYDSYPLCYNWLFLRSAFAGVVALADPVSILGTPNQSNTSAQIQDLISGRVVADLQPQNNADGTYVLERADSIWSCLPYPKDHDNPRDSFWFGVVGVITPTIPDIPPGPDPNLFLNVETWEEYAETDDASAATLDGGNGWDSAWAITDNPILDGVDDFEGYTPGDYTGGTLTGWGEGYSGDWKLTVYSEEAVDNFESYPVGTVDPFNMDGGVGWDSNWVFMPASPDGLDNFDAFANGYVFPTNDVTPTASGDTGFVDTWFTATYPQATQTWTDGSNNVTGLLAWFKADAITGKSDTDPLDVWLDSSANHYDLYQTVSGQRPTYRTAQLNGLPCVSFSATSKTFFAAPGILTCLTAADLFIVFKINTQPPATTPFTGLFKIGGNDLATQVAHVPYIDNVIYNPFMTSARKTTGTKTGLTSYMLLETWSAAGDWAQLFNGTSHSSTGTNTVDFTGSVYIGGNPEAVLGSAPDGVYLDGFIAEVIIFDHKLSTTDRAFVKSYIAAKYGLTIA